MQVSDDRFQAESGCSIFTLFEKGHQKFSWNIPVSNVQ